MESVTFWANRKDLADKEIHLLLIVAGSWVIWLGIVLDKEEDMVDMEVEVLGKAVVSPSRDISSLRGAAISIAASQQ